MRKIHWRAAAAFLLACLLALAPLGAGAGPYREVPLTAGVFFLLAQDLVELPAGRQASVQTAALSLDLLRLCSQNSFGGKSQAEVRQLAQKALDSLTDAEKEMFMTNFEDSIVPFCDGLFAGDEECLSLAEEAGVTEIPAWTEEEAAGNGDQDRWEILKAAVLSLQEDGE